MSNDTTDLSNLLRRWWPLLVVGALLAMLVAILGSSSKAHRYRATATVLVGPVSADETTLTASGGLTHTYSELATTRPFLAGAIKQTGTRGVTPERLETDIQASGNDVTRIVDISATRTNPRQAAALANAIAHELQDVANGAKTADATRLRTLLGSPALSGLTTAQRTQVASAAKDVLDDSAPGQIQTISSATPPTSPTGIGLGLLTALAGIAGLAVAAVLAAIAESFTRRPERPADEDETEVGPPIAVVDPVGDSGEAFRMLAAKTGLLGATGGSRSLVVLDSEGGMGAGHVAARLAASLAEPGVRVLAVDADPTGRGLTSALGLAGRAGYADLLALGEKAWNGHYDALRVQQEPSLDVLPLGSLDTPAITTPARTRRILQQLSKKADLIVINAPSLQDSAAALYWGSVAGAAVLVVEPDTPPSATAAEIDTLTHADVNLVGTVLVQPAGRVSLMRRWLAPSLNG